MSTIELTKADFLKRVVNYEANPTEWKYLGDKPCVIEFFATWCEHCQGFAPTIQEIAKEYNNQIYVYTIDIDKEQELSSAFGVESIPTLLFCPMTGDPHLAKGAMPKNELEKAITGILVKK